MRRRPHGLRWYMGMPYNIAIANGCDEKHALTLSRPVDSPLLVGRFSYGVHNMSYKVERACSSYGRGYARCRGF
jgi:hypothetical protein